jgi:hypothetical protein
VTDPIEYSYRCPLCDRTFATDEHRTLHLLKTTKHPSIIEEFLKVRFLLADREEALTVARRQRDEAREALPRAASEAEGRRRPLNIA